MAARTKKSEPWEKPAPKKSRHTKLTPASKAKAKASAKRKGRKYPSLVDNMNAAKAQRKSAARKKSTSKSKSTTGPKKAATSKAKSTTRKTSASRPKTSRARS